MASPQLENGYARIAHEIMEALAKVNLSPYESRMVWFVLRKTYGWRKKADWISGSQLRLGTGLDRQNLWRTRNSLVQKTMIVVSKDYAGRPIYSFQKDYLRWRVYSPETTSVSPKTTSVVSGDAHKRYYTKETKRKSIERESCLTLSPSILFHSKRKQTHAAAASDPRPREFFDWWASEYETRFAAKYVFSGAKEGALIKRLPPDYDIAKLKGLAARFFEIEDDWIKQRGGYTIGVFISQLNKLISTNGTGHAKPEVRNLGNGWLEVDGMRISQKDYERRWKTT